MNGLLRKDRPWMWPLSIGCALALGMVAASRGFLFLFVLTPGRHDEVFYTAAVMGLFVGMVAGVWDHLLGTREFLRQRPLSAAQLATAPIRAVVTVLLAWTLLTPILAWICASFWSGVFVPAQWTGSWELLGAVAIAWPAAAVSLAASVLPAPWWLRIVFGAAGALVVGMAIAVGCQGERFADPLTYVVLCVVATLGLFWLARFFGQQDADRDAPWPRRTTWIGGGAVALALAGLFAAGVPDAQRIALSELHGAYPELAVLDGRVVLWRRGEQWRDRFICDAEHVATDRRLPLENDARLRFRAPRPGTLFEIEAPRWHQNGQLGYTSGPGVDILVDHRGYAWGWISKGRRLFSIPGRQGDGPAFAPGSEVEEIRDLDAGGRRPRTVFVVDAADRSLWRFDGQSGSFTSFALPNGDVYRHRRWYHLSDGGDLSDSPLIAAVLQGERTDVEYVSGENGAYALRDDEWVEIQIPDYQPPGGGRQGMAEPRRVGDDPVYFTVELAGTDQRQPFRHEFAPRTSEEQAHYVHACAWSLLRPSVLQLVAFIRDRSGEREPSILDDQLLLGRSRPWLLALCVLVAVGCAWRVRRRLRRLGADPESVRFWTVVAVLLGPTGWLASLLCVRARSLRRPQLSPAAPPRIRASIPTQEMMS